MKTKGGVVIRSISIRAPLFIAVVAAACGGDDAQPRATDRAAGAPAAQLTEFQLEHGIGPFTEEVQLGPIDPAMAERGKNQFEMICAACHQMQDRLVGPPLGRVLERRSPTFVLNIVMNPEEMVRTHPAGQEMMREYLMVMPFQNVTQDEARAILEYLRTVTP